MPLIQHGVLPGAIMLLLITLVACGARQQSPTTSQALQRLPTVTPLLATAERSSTPTVARATQPPPATPSPTAAVVISEDGALTPSMARLNLSAERYAALGDPHAPLTLVEFADYGCPSCRFYELFTFADLKREYIDTGKVYYVYKDFPVTSRQGHLAAQAAECAGKQGHYWDMHRALFLEPQQWDAAEEQARAAFRELAAQLELDAAALDACVAAGEFVQEIDEDFAEGSALGLSGTPSFLIDRKLLMGAQSIEVFREVLDRELEGAQ